MRARSQAKVPGRVSPRIQRRRQADRERILRAAATLYADRGPEHVRLDEVADAADLSRGTLYSHFDSKEALTLALMTPVLTDAARALAAAQKVRTARDRVSAVLDMYLELWRRHADALRLAHRMMQTHDAAGSAKLHRDQVAGVVSILEKAGRAGLLRAPDPELAARTLARVAVPLLELYAPLPGGDALFIEAVRGLLLRDGNG